MLLEDDDTNCGCFAPGEGNAAECGLRADERDPDSMRRLHTGAYDREEECHCDCHHVPAEWELEEDGCE
jgi:hypothetical protein